MIPIPEELLEQIERGNVVLFVGDALGGQGSQSARLAAALAEVCGAHCDFCRSEGRCLRPENCTVPLSRAAQLYESRTNRQTLVDFVLRKVESGPPTPLHRALASLPLRVMLTTAYDDRLEQALREAGLPFLSVISDADIPFDDPDRIQVIRLHGTISQPSSLVLTGNDAADLFGRLNPITRIILQAYLATKTLLFAGYNLGDPYFLALYRQMTAPIARYRRPAYALQWPPDPLAAQIWQGQITFIAAEPLPFLDQLSQAARPQVSRPVPPPLPAEPYKFLDYFTREDAAIFFGRDLEADLLLSTVLAHQLTVFYGRSGTGKTSLLLARVVPALEQEGYHVAYARMLDAPTNEVKAAVRGIPPAQLSPTDRDRSLREVLADVPPPPGRLVVVLDQFEEVFIRHEQDAYSQFARQLADCLRDKELVARLDLRFVFGLREEYLANLDELAAILRQDILTHRCKLENLSTDKAFMAIVKPAAAFGLPVEESLIRKLLQDLDDRGLEPANLQIVLYRLYHDALEQGLWSETETEGKGLTVARYEALGETKTILTRYLDDVIAGLFDDKQRQGTRAVLKSMVSARKTKLIVTCQEILLNDLVGRLDLTATQVNALLTCLCEKRVVRNYGGDRYELVHEVLVERVWAWVSEEEKLLFDVRDMLNREMNDHQKFGYLLPRDKLELITSCHELLRPSSEEQELLLRSALRERFGLSYWVRRAPAIVGKVEDELFKKLESSDFEVASAAIRDLEVVASPDTVHRLAKLVHGDFDDTETIWVDHLGHTKKVTQTALNLTTVRQWRAMSALAKMTLPEAIQIMQDWTPPGMILIPAGPFKMGSKDSSDNPEHEVKLGSFWIDQYPVTNAQWAVFLASEANPSRELWTRAGWEWRKGKFPEPEEWGRQKRMPAYPVHGVCWHEALAYSRWTRKILLSEAQWEKSARGTDGRRYPWGDRFGKNKCNTIESGVGSTTPVGHYSPAGDSPYGVADMSGNVLEWCRNLFAPYPYNPDDGRESLELPGNRVLRGGVFELEYPCARVDYRAACGPFVRERGVGVRVGIGV